MRRGRRAAGARGDDAVGGRPPPAMLAAPADAREWGLLSCAKHIGEWRALASVTIDTDTALSTALLRAAVARRSPFVTQYAFI